MLFGAATACGSPATRVQEEAGDGESDGELPAFDAASTDAFVGDPWTDSGASAVDAFAESATGSTSPDVDAVSEGATTWPADRFVTGVVSLIRARARALVRHRCRRSSRDHRSAEGRPRAARTSFHSGG